MGDQKRTRGAQRRLQRRAGTGGRLAVDSDLEEDMERGMTTPEARGEHRGQSGLISVALSE